MNEWMWMLGSNRRVHGFQEVSSVNEKWEYTARSRSRAWNRLLIAVV
jgi:hypothetical protein